MPTKVQAKTAVDNAAAAIKADIDTTLPVGVNIIDGRIDFNPTHWFIRVDAGGTLGGATTLRDFIVASLNSQSRNPIVNSGLGRRIDPQKDDIKVIIITTTLATYLITNF